MDRVSVETNGLPVVVIVGRECILHKFQCSRIVRLCVAIGVVT